MKILTVHIEKVPYDFNYRPLGQTWRWHITKPEESTPAELIHTLPDHYLPTTLKPQYRFAWTQLGAERAANKALTKLKKRLGRSFHSYSYEREI